MTCEAEMKVSPYTCPLSLILVLTLTLNPMLTLLSPILTIALHLLFSITTCALVLVLTATLTYTTLSRSIPIISPLLTLFLLLAADHVLVFIFTLYNRCDLTM